ncbi:MAG: hypothetical protein FWC67_00730 [Defluviitaleaceae bacterium]|nr:hypothetical protein [Defluviitaleaceae bacterium]
MNNIQKQTAQMAREYGLGASAMLRFADLTSEMGELGKELVKATNWGADDLRVTDGLRMELGDVVFALALFANEQGLDLEECFAMTARKCKERFEQKGYIGSE